MNNEADTLATTVMEELVRVVAPLQGARTAPAIHSLIKNLGWDAPIEAVDVLVNGFSIVANAVDAVIETIKELQDTSSLQDLAAIGTQLKEVYEAATKIKEGLTSGIDFFSTSGIDQGAELVVRLVDYLLISYVGKYRPRVGATLVLIGLIAKHAPDPNRNYQAKDGHMAIAWERLPLLFSQPEQYLATTYGWGADDLTDPANPQGGIDEKTLFANVLLFMGAFGVSGGRYQSNCGTELRYPLYKEALLNGISQETGLQLYALPSVGARKKGLALSAYYQGVFKVTFDVGAKWCIDLKGKLSDDQDNLRFEIRPGESPLLELPSALGSGEFLVEAAQKTGKNVYDLYLLGSPDTPYQLIVRQASIALKLTAGQEGNWLDIEMALGELSLVIKREAIDGFLQKIFPSEGIAFQLGMSIGWSKQGGWRLGGAAGLETTISLNLTLFDVLTIESVFLALRAAYDRASKQTSLQILAAASANAKLGPFACSISRVGLALHAAFLHQTGPSISLGFKAPDGAGLSIDTSVITGGGFLFIDEEKGQYAGGLQLDIKNKITITAIGLINTRLPDGRKTFSLLVIISAEFPAIQLGFGFSLNGIGGMLGVNRTMMVDVLRSGIKNRTLNSIMFPKDIALNATKIISDLSSIFPPAEGRFVFGIMVKIAWGNSLITADLGVILELPSPVRLAILGRLQLMLPTEDNAILALHLDSIGILDFDRCLASIDASLYDSRIVKFDLAGDMAFRLGWGDNPIFAFSVGGFHPKFAPPPDFPKLERMSISLSSGDDMGIRLESYFALTSNSLQFGARLDAYFKKDLGDLIGKLSAQAYLALDALIKWPPFWFEIDISGGVDIKRNGKALVSAELFIMLSGPGPWLAHVKATVEFLGSHEVEFDWKSDDEENKELPTPPNLFAELEAALVEPSSWSAQQDGTSAGVTLRQLEPDGQLLVHPFGKLTLRQRAVPLTIKLKRAGSIPLPQPVTYSVEAITVGRNLNRDPGEARDAFAAGQFFDLSDSEKLTRPAFEALPSGYTDLSGGSASAYGRQLEMSWDYELTTIDAQEVERPKKNAPGQTLPSVVVDKATRHSAAGQAILRQSGAGRYTNPNGQIKTQVNPPTYVVTGLDNLGVQKGQEFVKSYVEAEALRGEDSAERSTQIVGSHEVTYAK